MNDIRWTYLKEVLERYGEAFIKNAQQNLISRDAVASGNLIQSMEIDNIEINDRMMSVTLSLADYWYYVENGRKAGKMPPISAIEKWIEVKPVIPKVMKNRKIPTVRQQAFAIARSIGKKGTKPKKFFEKAKTQTWKQFKDAIAEAIDKDIHEFVIAEVEKMAGIWTK